MATLDSDDIQAIARLRRPTGNTYFVRASGGDDDNTGLTWTSAWATANKAATTAVSGDTVLLGPAPFPMDPLKSTLRPVSGGSGLELM